MKENNKGLNKKNKRIKKLKEWGLKLDKKWNKMLKDKLTEKTN